MAATAISVAGVAMRYAARGASVAALADMNFDVAVRLPRPRSLDAMSTSEFGGCVARIRARFNAQGGVDA